MIRVLIADDHQGIRLALEEIVAAAPDLQVAGCAADGATAVALARQTGPDVVLMDLSMPVMDGIAATREIVGHDPSARVVVLTTYCRESVVREALAAGAVGYLLKDAAGDALPEAVRAAYRGEAPLSAPVRRFLDV